ncbi:MAG: response regulator [Vampirovibrionales bacterium]|nr:response regulator [Vampirovibrionales bacterium]
MMTLPPLEAAPTDTVLFVDDEAHILAALKRLLRNEPYQIITATSAKEGLEILTHTPAQLIVSDQRMPEMAGNAFLQQVKLLYPDTIRVILSGYADVNVILEALNKGEVYRFFTKPWQEEDLKASLRKCLVHYHSQHKGQQNASHTQHARRAS